MKIDQALEIAEKLQTLMLSEVESTQEGILLIRQLDLEAIQARATARESFNERAGALEEDLMNAMEAAGQEAKLESTTLQELRKAYGGRGETLEQTVRQIQSAASQIKQLDAYTQVLMRKALSFVQSYMDCLNPPSVVYNKRGRMGKTVNGAGKTALTFSRRA